MFTGSIDELHFEQARWYDPTVGRGLSEDPINGDPSNQYRYVGNSPTNYLDPSGLDTVTIVTNNPDGGDLRLWQGLWFRGGTVYGNVGSIDDLIAILEAHVAKTGQRISRLNLSGHGYAAGVAFKTLGFNNEQLSDAQAAKLRNLFDDHAELDIYSCEAAKG
jgi:hypothetical protein